MDSKNNPSVTMELVTLGVTLMTLKDYLRSKLDERGMTAAELARRSGVTKQNIGRILNDTPHPISGALPKVSVETIDKLAKALNVPLDEARLAAGYAPTSTHYVGGFEIQLPDDVTAVIPHSQINSESEAAEFREAFLLAYEITKKRIADRDKEK